MDKFIYGRSFSHISGKERIKEYVGVENNSLQIIKGDEKATQLQIYIY
ncbi:MAG: hypothetical protein HY769_10380 [Candidatus Stahlbacteria bacterium]|nr:hypothetical protein [Candidatus Stahlbacteria bacterium]